MNPNVIVKALRCSATAPPDCKRDCPYFRIDLPTPAELAEIKACFAPDDVPEKFFEGCDCDKIALDAATLIEQQLSEIETLRADVIELTARLAEKVWPERPKEDEP